MDYFHLQVKSVLLKKNIFLFSEHRDSLNLSLPVAQNSSDPLLY